MSRTIRATVERTICEVFHVNAPDNWDKLTRLEQAMYVMGQHDSGEVVDADELHGVDTDYDTLKF